MLSRADFALYSAGCRFPGTPAGESMHGISSVRANQICKSTKKGRRLFQPQSVIRLRGRLPACAMQHASGLAEGVAGHVEA